MAEIEATRRAAYELYQDFHSFRAVKFTSSFYTFFLVTLSEYFHTYVNSFYIEKVVACSSEHLVYHKNISTKSVYVF